MLAESNPFAREQSHVWPACIACVPCAAAGLLIPFAPSTTQEAFMLHQFTRKHRRDRALFEHWDALDASAFAHVARERLKEVQAGLQGYIVLPGDPQYNADRMLFNPVFNPFPVMIIYCLVESDVAIALQLAQEQQLPFTVRSGGHC